MTPLAALTNAAFLSAPRELISLASAQSLISMVLSLASIPGQAVNFATFELGIKILSNLSELDLPSD